MNSYTDHSMRLEHQRHRLEALIGKPDYTTAYHPKRLGHLFNRMADGVINWLTTGAMPKISKEIQGETEFWKVYDPTSNRTLYFDQENDLRAWIEERYYQ